MCCCPQKQGLKKAFKSLGTISEEPLKFTHKGVNFIITHTHFKVPEYKAKGIYDVIIFGHTHKYEISKEQQGLVINPGEAGGWLTGKHSAALLYLEDLKAEIINL